MSAADRIDAVCRPFGGDSELADCATWRASLRGQAVHDRMAEVAPEALDDFHDDPERPGVRVPGDEFWREFAKAAIEVERADHSRVGTRARSEWDWAELAATPLDGPDRARGLLRLSGKWLRHQLGEPVVLAMMQVHNRCMCTPPLDVFEVEKLWLWVCDRHREGRGR